MTLDPHHFQQWDRSHLAALNARVRAVTAFNDGLLRLEVNAERLANGEFVVERAKGVMPDGYAFDMPEADPAPPPRNVADYFPPTQESVDVHLALPAERQGGGNVLLQGGANRRETRYHTETIQVADDTTGVDERPIEVGRTRFSIKFAQEPMQEYVTLPIARVRRDAQGSFVLDAQYVPPCLSLAASARLQALTRKILELIVTKAGSLQERQRSILRQRELSPADVAAIGLLSTVNMHIPLLNHHLNAAYSHPEDLYRSLLALAGQLTAYLPNATVAPRDFPTYDHSRPSDSFNRIDRILLDMLGEAAPQSNYVEIPLATVRDNLYQAQLDDRLMKNAQFFLIARSSNVPEGELIQKLPLMLRVASPDTIEAVLRSYTRALNIEHTHRLPSGMPVDQQANYFMLQKRGPFWEAIQESKALSIFVPNEFSQVQLQLVAVQAP